MIKKALFALLAVVVVSGGVAALSAYEAHIINVTAHIENALAVHPEALEFGTVFPQEYLEKQVTVDMSESFLAEKRVDNIEYVIKQKPKCKAIDSDNPIQYAPVDYATHECPDDYKKMLSLCPYLSKMDGDPEDKNDVGLPSYFQKDRCIEHPADAKATGRLAKSEEDLADLWIIDLKVPPVEGTVGQDWPAGCPTVEKNNQDYGCDLWIEVTNISEAPSG